jgi:phage-related protein
MIVKAAAGSAVATLSVTNPGTVTAEKVTLDLLGPVLSPRIVNSTTGGWIAFAGTVAAGQHLVIDTGAYTAFNNGAPVPGQISWSGSISFMELTPGVNNLVIYGSNCTGATLLTVTVAPPYV